MKRLSMILASSALAISAHAANWLVVSKDDNGSSFLIDLDSIESSDIKVIDAYRSEFISVSIQRMYSQNNKSRGDNTIYSSDQQLLISCKNTSYYRRAYVHHGANHKVIESWQSKAPILTLADFNVTLPKTVGRTLVEETCAHYKSNQ